MKPVKQFSGAIFGMIRAFLQQLYNRYVNEHFREFPGNARQICRQIVNQLYAGDFHRTSLGHYNFFWIRDFGTVADSLVNAGYAEQVRHTLNWALLNYMQAGHVTLCIDRSGHTFNAPARKAVDALPWLLHAIVVSDYQPHPIEKSFLGDQLQYYIKRFLDPKTGDLRANVRFAEMRDAVRYDRSAYAITMIARLSVCARKLGLDFPFADSFYRDLLIKSYWNGDFFRADRSTDAWSSEGGLMPFYLGIVDDAAKAARTLDYIRREGYQATYPLLYSKQGDRFHYRFGMGNWLMPEYQARSIWSWHGAFYLHVLQKYHRTEYREEYMKFEQMIMRHRTFPELLNPDGTWFKTIFYSGDPGMIWAALFLDLPKP